MKYFIMILLLMVVGCGAADVDLSKPMLVSEIREYGNNVCDYYLYNNGGMGLDIFRANCGITRTDEFIMYANNTITVVTKPESWRP